MARRASRASARENPLWTCPKCGAKLLVRNLWHSCGLATVDDWLGRMGPRGRRLYNRFERLIGNCGEYYVAPAKTRIAFMGRIRFASVTRVTEDDMKCGFAMPHRLESPRFEKVEEVVPGWWVHWLLITKPEQLDEEVQGWLRESYRLLGSRGRGRQRPPTR